MSIEERGVPLARGQERAAPGAAAEQHAAAHRAEAHNMELMQTLDDAWNAQDMDTFSARHKNDVVVRWPGKAPTHGVADHRQESLEFFKTFPDQKVHNRPYKTLFASGDWTCSIARFTGTMKGSMKGPDGKTNHAAMKLTGGEIFMLGCPGPKYKNPKQLANVTQGLYITVDDVDKHFLRASKAGAKILDEPADQFYGDRRYSAADPEGHHWYFAQPVR